MTPDLLIDFPTDCPACKATYASAAEAATHRCRDRIAPLYRNAQELLPDDAPRPVHVPLAED